jgi:hypothetical protein
MKIAYLFAYLLLVAAGALSIPTLVAAFTGKPTDAVLVTISSSCLLLAIISFGYGRKPSDDTDLSKT